MSMRCHPGSFHLSFLLPEGVDASWADGRHFPALGCHVRVLSPLMKIRGPSRDWVFDAADVILRQACESHGPLSIAATLQSPPPCPGRDSWTIIVGADVAFAPTGLGAHFPRA